MKLFNTDEHGKILAVVEPSPGTETFYTDFIVGDPNGASHYREGEFANKPSRPSVAYQWDAPTFSWVLDLDAAKVQAKSRITVIRNAAEKNGFEAYGVTFDSDPMAIQRIGVAVQAAQVVGETFKVDWTTADNSVITLDYQQVLSLPVFMAQAANDMHIKARALKDQIDAATTLEEINAVAW